MGEYNDNEDDEQTNERNPLRDVVKKLEADLKENRAALAKYQEKERVQSLAETLGAKGLPAKVAELIPPDADAEEWLSKYADVFNLAAKQAESDEREQFEQVEETANADQVALAAEWQRMQETEQRGSTAVHAAADAKFDDLAKAAAHGGGKGISEYMARLGL